MSEARRVAEEALGRWDLCDPSRYSTLHGELEGVYECADDMAKALLLLLDEMPEAGAHEWGRWAAGQEWDSCRACGIVRRADDVNKPCRGPVQITLRAPAPSPARDEVREAVEAFLEAEAAAWRTTGRPLPGDDDLAATYDARRRRLLAALSRDHAPDAE